MFSALLLVIPLSPFVFSVPLPDNKNLCLLCLPQKINPLCFFVSLCLCV